MTFDVSSDDWQAYLKNKVHIDGQIDRLIDAQIDGQIDRQIDRQNDKINIYLDHEQHRAILLPDRVCHVRQGGWTQGLPPDLQAVHGRQHQPQVTDGITYLSIYLLIYLASNLSNQLADYLATYLYVYPSI